MLEKMTFNQARMKILSGLFESLADFRSYEGSVQGTIDTHFRNGNLHSRNFDEVVQMQYGVPKDKDDIEYLLAKILTLFVLVSVTNASYRDAEALRKQELLKNVQDKLPQLLPEFKFKDFKRDGNFIEYESTEQETVTDNLRDIPNEVAEPIKELLKPMKSDVELIGYISLVYKDFEKVNKEDLKNLNETDKSIFESAKKLAKQVVNCVDGAKGHQGNSLLTIRDIAHNFALNASLVQKLINLNKVENKGKA